MRLPRSLKLLVNTLTIFVINWVCRYLMGVASLGGLSPVGACGSDDAPSDAASATVDFAGAQYHFSHALGMLNRLREEAAEQGEPNAQVCRSIEPVCVIA